LLTRFHLQQRLTLRMLSTL